MIGSRQYSGIFMEVITIYTKSCFFEEGEIEDIAQVRAEMKSSCVRDLCNPSSTRMIILRPA